MPLFEPKKLRDNKTLGVVLEPKKTDPREFTSPKHLVSPNNVEMIVFVGYPASGKSTLARQLCDLKAYVQVNQDTLGSAERCWKKAREELNNSKSVIIDNTNFFKEQRQRLFATVSVGCCVMTEQQSLTTTTAVRCSF